jgi:hypothetical protein
VIVYQAATLPIGQPRIERTTLRALPGAQLGMADTLAIPPAQAMEPDEQIRARLAALDAASEQATA